MTSMDDSGGVSIFIKNLPKGITESGISNLCLTAGKTLSVKILQNRTSAFVKFKTRNEAVLAIENLNNKYPYFMKVSLSKPKPNYKNDNSTKTETDENDRWIYSDFRKCKFFERRDPIKDVTQDVSPYFQFQSELDNPSLVMRQEAFDFHTSKRCISMGRGYINMGDVDRYHLHHNSLLFSQQSAQWTHKSDEMDMRPCSTCGCIIFDGQDDSTKFCSKECENILMGHTVSDDRHSLVFDFFAVGKSGTFEVLEKDDRGVRITCCIVLDDERPNFEHIQKVSSEVQKISLRAKVGDMVITSYDKVRNVRGIVLCDEGRGYVVHLIDYGKVISVREVYGMEEHLKDIPWFGGVVLIQENDWADLETVKFQVKRKREFNSWLCDLISVETDEVVGEAALEEYCSPTSLGYAPLESGSTVVISYFANMRTVYVRRVDSTWNDRFVRLNNDVAAYTLEGRRYKVLPKCGDICSARYEKDGCYYRAIVRGVTSRSAIVAFVDYGNDQETKLADLSYLPLKVRRIQSFAVPVCLKGLSNVSCPETVDYFNRLTSEEIKFCLRLDNEYVVVNKYVRTGGTRNVEQTYDESNPEEVILTEKDSGVSVNITARELLIPAWEKDSSLLLKSGEAYYSEDIREIELDTDKEQDIFVLYVDEIQFSSSGTFWATRYRSDYLGHLNGELKRLITGYCACLEDDPYLPRAGEICLAEFEGHWHRAICLDDTNTTTAVFLMDCGLSVAVTTSGMRKILKEFLEMPALAVQCIVAGFNNLNVDEKEKLAKYMKSKEKKCVKSVNVLKKSEDVYLVEIPFASDLLRK